MSEAMKSPIFRVEFDKVCSACGAECPYLTVQEFEDRCGYPETRKRRKCKNERICRDAALSEFKRLKKYLVKEFWKKADENIDES